MALPKRRKKKGPTPFDDGGEVFAPTLDGFRRYVRTTRPVPAKEDVLSHARTALTPGEVKTLGREYRKLSRASS